MIVNKRSNYGNQLDVEFKSILRDIKPYIISVNSAYHLNQYRLWLEVLSNRHITNKEKRNIFLRELAGQIKRRIILSPFTEVPDPYFFSDLEAVYFDEEDYLCVPDFKLIYPNMDLEVKNYELPKNPDMKSEKYKSLPRNIFSQKGVTNEDKSEDKKKKKRRRHNSCKPSTGRTEKLEVERRNSTTTFECVTGNPNYLKLMENVRNINFLDLRKLESSSWFDLSCSNSTKSSLEPAKESPKYIDEDTNTEYHAPETSTFTPKCDELDRISLKASFKDTNVIVTDLKKTIEGLQLRLTETIKQNNDLKNEIKHFEIKDDIDPKFKSSNEDFGRLQETFTDKLDQVEQNFVKQLEDLQKTYEAKIECIQVDKEISIKEKDNEIIALKAAIETECARMNNEITSLRAKFSESVNLCCNNKIDFLQRCIKKMDNLFHRSEKEYINQVKRLKRQLDNKEKSMLMFLKSQKVGVMSKASADTQEHFDVMVNYLESKYAKMFEIQAHTYTENLTKQDRYIDYLKKMLKKNAIYFEDHSD
ncbi:unnamed protein product [Brassicogethes aeneus]|uniref:DUF4485 domain-containing protein n=1 Tax=Brassicogethes aeneus TaxID=1431903 RepID=A0A9P0FQT5_BRAAE|nr:unnamed protein product [Brassicogethes aeneus]